MDKNKLGVIVLVLAMIAVVGLGYLLGVSPQLESSAQADNDRVLVEQENVVHEATLAALMKQHEGMEALEEELAELRVLIPDGAQLPQFVKSLDATAVKHGVALTTISVQDGQYFVPAEAVAEAPAADEAGTSTGEPALAGAVDDAKDAAAATEASVTPDPSAAGAATPDSAATGAPAMRSAEVAAAAQKLPEGALVAVPITLALSGEYANVLNFTDGLRTGPRLFLVTSLTTAPGTAAALTAAAGDTAPGDEGETPAASSSVNATITGYVYVLLNNARVAPAA
ncbi:hypothetical protein [Homoserinimonas sp. OAct 916]|uniref:hypothetical protein n=1 Tax=Homoserinimonas sp. OAct 916 TaxID=2211450 RepID=UPI000DBE5D09|nr:hypothetical protein [Homoserinimonas sp. OAct 916]